MKLIRSITNEAYAGEQLVGLTLDEITKAGKVTNPYQTFVLSWLSEYFKDGLKAADLPLRNAGEVGGTSTDTINAIKALSPTDAVALATYLRACVDAGESALHDHSMTGHEWINFVLQKQK
jgi:hypothetical protein